MKMYNYILPTIVLLLGSIPSGSQALPTKNKYSTAYVELSIGELVDKITILEIKSEKITNETKLTNICTELDILRESFAKLCNKLPKEIMLCVQKLKNTLKRVNETLWKIEDDIREKESRKEFDDLFVQLARSVYITNDERCKIKRELNTLLGSHLVEEKSYTNYRTK